MTQTMPAPLKAIYEQACSLERPESNLDALQGTWAEYVSNARQQIPDAHVEADGEVIYLGELSPGCQTCKEGTWDCIFVTMKCNLDCEFCYSPHAIPRDYAGSAFGSTPEEIAANHARTRITGVSFSGGEPFSDMPRLLDWVAWFKSRYPDKYYWVYTNGLLAGEENVCQLRQAGIDEIRFNLAATGYDHPIVMRNVATAARLIPHVTVEIPAIPDHTPKLLSCLANWCAAGVRFLNLHELMYEPGTNAASMVGARQVVVTADGHRTEINPASRAVALAVMQQVQDQNLPLSVNDCSLQSKLRQLRGRRRNIARLAQALHEKLVQDQVYESYCAYRGEEDYFFFHPDSIHEMRLRYPDYDFVRLVRTAPLSVYDNGRWITCEKI